MACGTHEESVHLAWQLDWSTFLSDTFLDPALSTPPRLGHRGPERASAAIAEVMQDQNQRYPWPMAPMGSVQLAWKLDWSTFLSDTFLDPASSTHPRLASTRALGPRACKCGDGDSRSDARSKSAVPMINALSMINSDRINALSVVVHADPFLRKHGGARLHCDGAWQSRLPPHSGERRTRSRCAGAAQHHLSSIEAAAPCAWPVHINLRTWCIR